MPEGQIDNPGKGEATPTGSGTSVSSWRGRLTTAGVRGGGKTISGTLSDTDASAFKQPAARRPHRQGKTAPAKRATALEGLAEHDRGDSQDRPFAPQGAADPGPGHGGTDIP